MSSCFPAWFYLSPTHSNDARAVEKRTFQSNFPLRTESGNILGMFLVL